jgi:hypothetical protein
MGAKQRLRRRIDPKGLRAAAGDQPVRCARRFSASVQKAWKFGMSPIWWAAGSVPAAPGNRLPAPTDSSPNRAQTFTTYAEGTDADAAFREAVEQAQ